MLHTLWMHASSEQFFNKLNYAERGLLHLCGGFRELPCEVLWHNLMKLYELRQFQSEIVLCTHKLWSYINWRFQAKTYLVFYACTHTSVVHKLVFSHTLKSPLCMYTRFGNAYFPSVDIYWSVVVHKLVFSHTLKSPLCMHTHFGNAYFPSVDIHWSVVCVCAWTSVVHKLMFPNTNIHLETSVPDSWSFVKVVRCYHSALKTREDCARL